MLKPVAQMSCRPNVQLDKPQKSTYKLRPSMEQCSTVSVTTAWFAAVGFAERCISCRAVFFTAAI